MAEKLKVLILNGSPRVNGNTSIALRELQQVLEENDVEVENIQIGKEAIRGCIACGYCAKHGKCMFKDIVNDIAPKFEAADGLIVASPVYYGSANATLIACLDRLFFSTSFDKTMKVGASVVCARRSGCTATFGIQPVLEQHPRPEPRRCGTGRRRPADHARPGKEHGLPDAKHRVGQRKIRPAGKRRMDRHALYQVNVPAVS